MKPITHILADGISPGMVFAILLAIVVALANVFGKKKQTESTIEQMKAQREARERSRRKPVRPRAGSADEARLDLKEAADQKGLRDRVAGGIAAQVRAKANRKKAAPPPMPALPVRAHAATRIAAPTPNEPVLPQAHRREPNEAARNVRLMLQPAGIREAFILSEVLGKPKALRDE